MGVLTFVDAAYPPLPATGDGMCFYIGGDAVHVWTAAEVNAQPQRYRLPIWVRSNPAGVVASADAAACVAALASFGVPRGCLVALDSETSIDPAYVRVFVTVLNDAGYPVIDYGTQSSVFGNANPDGYYWGADWTDVPHLHSGDAMTQYVSFAAYDESEAVSTLPFWDTRAPAPAPPPAPGPVPGPPVPDPPATEKDRSMNQIAAGDKYAVISLTYGSASWIAFFADPTLQGKTPQALRVAVHHHGEGPSAFGQIENITVAGDKTTVTFTSTMADGISVERTDDPSNWVPVAFNLG